jgi:hypothetical protein
LTANRGSGYETCSQILFPASYYISPPPRHYGLTIFDFLILTPGAFSNFWFREAFAAGKTVLVVGINWQTNKQTTNKQTNHMHT